MQKGKFSALLPIFVFLLLFVGSGIATGDFYTIPAVVGFIIALAVALVQNRGRSFQDKLSTACKGAGDETILTMVLIFILAGAFSGVVKAAGGVESTVNFGLSIIPPNLVVVGVFVVACFISLSMGTSMGTIASLAPISLGVADKTGLPVSLCIGAVVCGAMFGDNLSMISDTTIAAVRTQGCRMNDKFKQNFFIVLPAALLTAGILAWRTSSVSFQITGDLHYNFWQIVPYLVVLVGALIGFNVFAVLTAGIIASSAVGLSLGMFRFDELFGKIGAGIESMYEIAVISLLVSGIVALVKYNGGIQCLIDLIKRHVKTRRGAELGMAGISAVVDMCTANNTVAIVMAGGIVKEIGDEYGVPPKRAASILDIFTSMVQGLIPYGAQLLTAASLVGIAPFDIMPHLYYPILMGLSALLWILLVKRKGEAACPPSKQTS